MSVISKSENDITLSLSNWVLRVTCLLMLLVILTVAGASASGPRKPSASDLDPSSKEAVKLRALADKLILITRGLSSSQSDVELDMAEEFAPLAEFVIKQLDPKKGPHVNNERVDR